MSDPVNHPSHYAQVPEIECIDVVEHFSFLRGNAIKYLWRAGAKGDLVTDLRKAAWYIQREIDAATAAAVHPPAVDHTYGSQFCQDFCGLSESNPIHGVTP